MTAPQHACWFAFSKTGEFNPHDKGKYGFLSSSGKKPLPHMDDLINIDERVSKPIRIQGLFASREHSPVPYQLSNWNLVL